MPEQNGGPFFPLHFASALAYVWPRQQRAAMNPFRFQRQDGSSSCFGRTTAVAGLLLVALLAYLSADPEAHERFHHDAGKDDHHCVVTDFAAGEAFFLAPRLTVRPAVTPLYEIVRGEAPEFFPRPVAFALLPSCGPPPPGSAA
jgi:hypothetical protein